MKNEIGRWEHSTYRCQCHIVCSKIWEKKFWGKGTLYRLLGGEHMLPILGNEIIIFSNLTCTENN